MSTATQTYEPSADLTALLDHPDNPRKGDDAAVGESIETNGFYGAILVQRSTKRILAGHTRRRTLTAAGQTTGPVIWIDCGDSTARRILLADNRTAELATWDDVALAALLDELGAAGDDALAGTGFDMAELGAITEDLSLPVPTPYLAANSEARNEREHKAERYENTTLRQITLVMQREEYEPLVLGLDKLRVEWDAASFAVVVQRLVEERLAEAPA